MMKIIKTKGSTFGKRMKSGVCAILGLVLAGLTAICTPGCDKIDKAMGFDENKVKDTLLEIANNAMKDNAILSGTVRAERIQDLSLVQESFTKRVGYANVVFRSTRSNKEVTLKFKVNITGSAFDEKQLCEMQLSDASESLKLLALGGGDD